MPSFIKRNRTFSLIVGAALLAGAGACDPDNNSGTGAPADQTIGVGDTPFLPPTYTEQQCLDLVSSFPGWSQVAPMPEYDAQGRPTLFYAVIPITAASQLDDLALVGIDVQPQPIFTTETGDAAGSGPGVVSKSTCGKYEIHWALVPGPVFNAIKTATLEVGETLVDAIVVQPVPDVFADTSITYEGAHPASYEVLHDAGYLYMGKSAPAGDSQTTQSALSLGGIVSSVVKKVVRTVAGLTHEIPDLISRGIGWIDCQFQSCVSVAVKLDLRNTDANFGGSIGAPTVADTSTPMVRAWGAGAGKQMQLPGVRIAAEQQLVSVAGYGITMRFEGTTNADSTASLQVRTGKPTRFCMAMENDAATLNDYFTRMEICGLERGGARVPRNVFSANSNVTLQVQNKYVNTLAQLSDGRAYLREMVGYNPHKASALVGPLANQIGKLSNGRAVTPCLDFPNVPLEAINGALIGLAAAVPVVGPVLSALILAAEVAIEVDMWLPEDGGTLTSRGIPTHEYGHFAMCSLLYDEDWTSMVQIPSLIIQRIADGSDQVPTDQVGYIMEGWADFFTGQVASGSNYFSPLNANDVWSPHVGYCLGSSSACLDWNYVEDMSLASNGGVGTVGFDNQVRRIATTLLDAFDGHTPITNNPGVGDFWADKLVNTINGKNVSPTLVPGATHTGDAKDEVIRLPGTALRTFIHNWTHATWPLGWRVNEAQFFGALNATMRAARNPEHPSQTYSWCDVCKMFSQHDGLSCGVTGNSQSGGFCNDTNGLPTQPAMTIEQMVNVCTTSPAIPGFIGPPPAADPSSTCTFTGCPARTILVGSIGDSGARCVGCGPHQMTTGARACAATECARANTSATTCVDCADNQIVGGADGNSCVSCPPFQGPNADKTACVSCGAHQVVTNGICVTCPVNQVVGADSTCQSCPAGQVPLSNNPPTGWAPHVADVCIPAAECTCTGEICRRMSNGLCINVIG